MERIHTEELGHCERAMMFWKTLCNSSLSPSPECRHHCWESSRVNLAASGLGTLLTPLLLWVLAASLLVCICTSACPTYSCKVLSTPGSGTFVQVGRATSQSVVYAEDIFRVRTAVTSRDAQHGAALDE
jgi:hypothetical protein